MAKFPKAAREFIKLHGYQWKNEILLSMDYDNLMNHSENPNTYYDGGYRRSRRSEIREGWRSVTNDYRAFEAAFMRRVSKPRTK